MSIQHEFMNELKQLLEKYDACINHQSSSEDVSLMLEMSGQPLYLKGCDCVIDKDSELIE